MEPGHRDPLTTARSSGTVARCVLAQVLLAVHLAVFALGAVVGRGPAPSAVTRSVVTVLTTGGDGATISASSEGRLERITRPRSDRGEHRGPEAPPLGFFLAEGALTIAPASLTGSVAIAPASGPHLRLPSVVHGPRGPPRAC